VLMATALASVNRALMPRREHEMRQAGTWDEAQQTRTDTICPYCGVGCTLTLHVQDNQIVKATSLEHDIGHGHLCVSKDGLAGNLCRLTSKVVTTNDARTAENILRRDWSPWSR
jgi:anaerobic selenocysteine-containing dehydrogenase